MRAARVAIAAVVSAAVGCSLAVDLDGLSGQQTNVRPVADAGSPGRDAGGEDAALPADTGTLVDAALPICRAGFTGQGCKTPCPANTAGRSCDYRLALALDIPLGASWRTPTDVPYSANRTAGIGAFARVAYLLQLDDEEVWVELDAFTQDASRLGVPVDWIFDVPTTNMRVYSFAARQGHVLTPTAGSIELWSNCYSTGPGGVYDSDDDISQSEPDCYGSLQLHVGGAPVLSFNRWANGDTMDVGIGKAPTDHPDWTFAKNGSSFQKRRLEVYVR